MNRIVQLDRWLDGQFAKVFPRLARRFAWLDVRTKAGPTRGTVIVAWLLGVIVLLLVVLITLRRFV